MEPLRKILVPTDFSAGADAALELALEVARRFGASITLLHVYELPVTYAEEFSLTNELMGSIESGAHEALRKAVDQAVQRAREHAGGGAAIAISSRLLCGGAAVRIAEEAWGYDLVVMGTRGRGMLAHLLIGSVAERVVRTAPCPVLTVRSAEHQAPRAP